MKHLRKYNESVDKPVYNREVSDYVKLVFADFIDDGDEFEFEDGVSNIKYGDGLPFAACYISVEIPTLHKPNLKMDGYSVGSAKGDVKKFIENTEEVLEIYKEIETCINRVNDKYPDIRHEITKETIEMYRDKVLSHINILIEWDEHTQIGVS